jgi:FkbM family methyltransferase
MKLFNPFRRPRVRLDDAHAYHVLSFAQEGEDRLLARLLEGTRAGFYVDVGAHHPQRFSNTYAFYLRGWRGINIDPLPGMRELFDRIRPEDINLETAIGFRSIRTYFQFAETALNTFDPELSEERVRKGHRPSARQEIAVVPLADVLDRRVPPGTPIDFLTVDAEGLDLEVLRSNDWRRFRPRFVLAEERSLGNLLELGPAPLVRFLGE